MIAVKICYARIDFVITDEILFAPLPCLAEMFIGAFDLIGARAVKPFEFDLVLPRQIESLRKPAATITATPLEVVAVKKTEEPCLSV